nr:hypothetical protein [Tanacetum cinerariifolium]
QYSRRATRVAQSKALSSAADEPASLLRDDSQGEAFPTVSSLDAGQDRENINKTSALPYESSPRVPSLDADEGCSNQRGCMEIWEEVRVERSTKLGSNDTKEMINVLSTMEAFNILTSKVAAISVSPIAAATTVGVPTVNGLFPTVSAIFTTANLQKIKGLDRSNEVIAMHLQEYEQVAADLSVGEKNELINKLTKHFKGMTLEEIKEKFIPVWKQLEDFVPMSSKEESERVERQGSSKRIKTSKSASEGVSGEELKEMMQLVPLEEVYVEAL